MQFPALIAQHARKDGESWLGNSVVVAMRHYAMATDKAFQKAAGWMVVTPVVTFQT